MKRRQWMGGALALAGLALVWAATADVTVYSHLLDPRAHPDDARRAVRMFEQLGVPILGVVENMSHFVGDDGKEYDLFGRGGASVTEHVVH